MSKFRNSSMVLFFVFCFALQTGYTQFTQINVMAKTDNTNASGKQNLYVQSMDGMATCRCIMDITSEVGAMKRLKINFATCNNVLTNLSGVSQFSKIEQTDSKYIYADNDEFSVRMQKVNGKYHVEKIISKKPDLKYTWNFSYNDALEIPEGLLAKPFSSESSNDESKEPETNTTKSQVTKPKDKTANKSKTNDTYEKSGMQYYVLKKGDYIYKLSREYGCSPIELMKLNNIKESTTLFPGQTILLCDAAAAGSKRYTTPTATNENKVSGNKSSSGNVSSSNLSAIETELKDIKVKYEKVFAENTSLKTYAEEIKLEYDQLISEYEALKKSYENLNEEYKVLAKDNKDLRDENARLKKLLEEGGISAKENELTPEEKEQYEAIKGQMEEVQEEMSEMKDEIEEARSLARDEGSIIDENSDQQIMGDPSYISICEGISSRCKKVDNFKRLRVEKSMLFKRKGETKVLEVKPQDTKEFKEQDLGKNNTLDQFVLPADMFALMNLDYNFHGATSDDIETKFYLDVEKIEYKAKISDKSIKFKKSSKNNTDDLNEEHPHVKAIKTAFNDGNMDKGTYYIHLLEGQYNLEGKDNGSFFTLKKYNSTDIIYLDSGKKKD